MKFDSRLLLCLLASLAIWLFYNLSQQGRGTVERTVVVSSSLEGRAAVSSTSAVVTARCQSTGFRLIFASLRRSPILLEVDASDLRYEGEDRYRLPNTALYKYSGRIFSDRLDVEVILSDDPVFLFGRENCAKFPVHAVCDLSFRRQYMAGGEMTLSPDSVLVYADSTLLSSLEAVYTEDIAAKDVHKNLYGSVALEAVSGLRYSVDEVEYTLPVSRYVEMNSTLRPSVRNLPEGVELQLLPGTVQVSFKCAFPVSENPFDCADFYIDYKEFEASRSGNCLIRLDKVPSGVLSWKTDPDVCECVEYQK